LCFQKLLPDFRQGFTHPCPNKTKIATVDLHVHSDPRTKSNNDVTYIYERERTNLSWDCATQV
jgi:hypothetical protein